MTDIFGIYGDKEQADVAVNRLLEEGFTAEEISVVLVDAPTESDRGHSGHSTAVVTSGIALGGTLGMLAGFAALAIPGVGPMLVAGPLLGMIAGAGVGGTVGGLIGTLNHMGVPHAHVEHYEGALNAGQIVLSVHCNASDRIAHASDLLEATGAEHITQNERPA